MLDSLGIEFVECLLYTGGRRTRIAQQHPASSVLADIMLRICGIINSWAASVAIHAHIFYLLSKYDRLWHMKIGIVSQAPSITTGFGMVCSQIAYALTATQHDVVCFGIGVLGETFDRAQFPYRIWAVGEHNLIQTFSDFLRYENIDVLLVSLDIIAVQYWVNVARAVGWDGPIVVYFVLDGLPIDREFLEVLTTVQAKITATHAVADYLKTQGIYNVAVAPHGVDGSLFKPLDNRSELRKGAGLGDKFLIGMFGRNNERKQHPRVMMAVSQLRKEHKADNIQLYLHCQPQDDPGLGGWNLSSIAKDLEIEDLVVFPETTFNQMAGTPLLPQESAKKSPNADKLHMPFQYNYIERINCCDLIINASYCGGFELSLIEAQACGIPLAVTNDNGIMAEVVGEGAYLLEPIDIGIWRTGARQYFISPRTIAEAIVEIKNSLTLQQSLREKGLANSSKYLWKNLYSAIIGAVESIPIH